MRQYIQKLRCLDRDYNEINIPELDALLKQKYSLPEVITQYSNHYEKNNQAQEEIIPKIDYVDKINKLIKG